MSGKKERRQMRLESERRQEMELAVVTPRDPRDRTWGFFGVGALQAQFVRRPSRQHGVCYEIRGDFGNLRLFRSLTTSPGGELVVGYARVAGKPALLGRLLRTLEGLQVPVRRQLEPVGVCDGETLEVAVRSGVDATARFMWHAGAVPSGWEKLAEVAESSIKEFDALEVVDEGQPQNVVRVDLRPGDFYEDCFYHPCLCTYVDLAGEVRGISLVDGTTPRACSLGCCGVRKLTLEQALIWRLEGPQDLPADTQFPPEKRWWTDGDP